MSDAHPKCQTEHGHVCQQPSGRACVEAGCDQAAGTLWGPLWCPDHDEERINRVGDSLAELAAGSGWSAMSNYAPSEAEVIADALARMITRAAECTCSPVSGLQPDCPQHGMDGQR